MGISPIIEIRQLGEMKSTKNAEAVTPPFALERSNRTDDDAYGAAHEEAERGLEEEEETPAGEAEGTPENGSDAPSTGGGVNLFA